MDAFELKIVIVLMLVLIVLSLTSAGYFVVRDRGTTRNTAWALTVRIALSVSLFLFIWFAHWMGWIQSNSVVLGR